MLTKTFVSFGVCLCFERGDGVRVVGQKERREGEREGGVGGGERYRERLIKFQIKHFGYFH